MEGLRSSSANTAVRLTWAIENTSSGGLALRISFQLKKTGEHPSCSRMSVSHSTKQRWQAFPVEAQRELFHQGSGTLLEEGMSSLPHLDMRQWTKKGESQGNPRLSGVALRAGQARLTKTSGGGLEGGAGLRLESTWHRSCWQNVHKALGNLATAAIYILSPQEGWCFKKTTHTPFHVLPQADC